MPVRRGTALGRVRGLGSAREGSHHWWVQRLTAAANVLLFTWFLASLLTLPKLDHFTMLEWLSQPLVAVPMVLLCLNIFWHIRLGLQVAIEDYAEGGTRIFLLLLATLFTVACGALSIFSILSIAFGA